MTTPLENDPPTGIGQTTLQYKVYSLAFASPSIKRTSARRTPVTGPAVRARAGLAALAVGVAACLAVALTPDPNPPFVPPEAATSDLDLYRRVVDRVHAGESYYDAAHHELTTHGYPTRSVFNWRTPVYAWLLGSPPGYALGQLLLAAGVVAAVGMACSDVLKEGGLVAGGLGGVALVGATCWCLGPETYLFMELWAAMLLLLSVGFFRRGWNGWGVAAGLAALFYRELSLPYAVVGLGMAVRAGRRREALAWTAGLLAFVGFMAVHAARVHARLGESDLAMNGTWLQFGGVRFVLATARDNYFLTSAAPWAAALALPAAVLGLCALPGENGLRIRLTGLAYLAAFSVVGYPFNDYWGFLDAPLLAVGFAFAPAGMARLWSEARGPVGGSIGPGTFAATAGTR